MTRCLRAGNVRHIVPVGRSGPAPLLESPCAVSPRLLPAPPSVGVGMVSVTAPAAAKTTPPTAAAASIKTSPYVALGDSYSSAAGVSPQVLTAPPACSRSQLNYAEDESWLLILSAHRCIPCRAHHPSPMCGPSWPMTRVEAHSSSAKW